MNRTYRGRLAPTPSGQLHLGHARTFWLTYQRCIEHNGSLLLRIEDLDPHRSKPEYIDSMFEDFKWMGITWNEGPVHQSLRREAYINTWERLKNAGYIYPCSRSRKDVKAAAYAPHEEDEFAEPIFPPQWRPAPGAEKAYHRPGSEVSWRFRVPDGEVIKFTDIEQGELCFEAGKDFGDFVIWRRDDVPAYELAVVTDDIEHDISEVVRGMDLLRSTARQLLLYQALNATPPAWCHLPLVCDEQGKRLAKRHNAMALSTLRKEGKSFEACIEQVL